MKEPKFEEALERLEKIVADMENESITLEESLKKYEEGVKLAKLCSKKLKEADKKIEMLTKSDAGKIELKPFGEKAEDGVNSSGTDIAEEDRATVPGEKKKRGKKASAANEDELLF